MKNVCKKLFSLMLVAVLLVSIVPFNAMAAANDMIKYVDDSDRMIKEVAWDGEGMPSWDNAQALAGNDENGNPITVGAILNETPIEYGGKNIYKFRASVAQRKTVIVKIACDGVALDGADGVEVTIAGTEPTWDEVKHLCPAGYQNPVRRLGGDGTTWVFDVTKTPVQDPVVEPIEVVVKSTAKPENDNVIFRGEKVPANGESALVKNLLSYVWSKEWDGVYDFDHAWSSAQGDVNQNTAIKAGDSVSIMLKPTTPPSTTTPPTTTPPTDDKVSQEEYVVKLKFYTNNNATAVRVVDITRSYALDNVVSWAEVQQYVKDNFVSSNSLGIKIDGIYKYEGSAWANWVTSGVLAQDQTIPAVGHRGDDITMMVMLTGYSGGKVSLKNNNNADSSNPKTGDNIFIAVTFMAVSATALTGLYFYNKKRIVK